jgi:hypothetical protein
MKVPFETPNDKTPNDPKGTFETSSHSRINLRARDCAPAAQRPASAKRPRPDPQPIAWVRTSKINLKLTPAHQP